MSEIDEGDEVEVEVFTVGWEDDGGDGGGGGSGSGGSGGCSVPLSSVTGDCTEYGVDRHEDCRKLGNQVWGNSRVLPYAQVHYSAGAPGHVNIAYAADPVTSGCLMVGTYLGT